MAGSMQEAERGSTWQSVLDRMRKLLYVLAYRLVYEQVLQNSYLWILVPV